MAAARSALGILQNSWTNSCFSVLVNLILDVQIRTFASCSGVLQLFATWIARLMFPIPRDNGCGYLVTYTPYGFKMRYIANGQTSKTVSTQETMMSRSVLVIG
jgi:hypothetical protein